MLSTTFNCRETALLKNFLDHLNYLLHRPLFYNKKALVISTATIKSIASTLRGMGVNKCYGIWIRSVSWNAYIMKSNDQKKIYMATEKFSKDVQSGKMHYPKTDVLIPYNLFRGISKTYVHGSEYETKNGEYHSNLAKKNIAYDSKIPLLVHQRIIVSVFFLIGKIASKIYGNV